MARIPETELERLKNEVSVERLVEASGVELKRGGKDMLGRCPFHEDDTASLMVSPGKNLWHCFGCGAAGGPIDWVMKTRGVSFRHAVELLREGVGGGLPSSGAGHAADAAPIKRTTVRALPAPVAFDADDAQLLGQVADYYAATLKQSPEAQAGVPSPVPAAAHEDRQGLPCGVSRQVAFHRTARACSCSSRVKGSLRRFAPLTRTPPAHRDGREQPTAKTGG